MNIERNMTLKEHNLSDLAFDLVTRLDFFPIQMYNFFPASTMNVNLGSNEARSTAVCNARD